MSWSPYRGDVYLSFEALTAWLEAAARTHPEWLALESIGTSREGRPIWLATLGARPAEGHAHPALWIDGGTHAAEWTGVMSCLFTLSRWLEALAAGEPSSTAWFRRHLAYVVPCISPDGFQATLDGAPGLRSSLRPPKAGEPRVGLDACDVDGDGAVRWMRWRHPTGPFVPDPEVPETLRPRRLEDDPGDAYFVCREGLLLDWDGYRWTEAPARFGLDLNRNFPGSWAPFASRGLDGGTYALSEPESRAVVDAFVGRPTVGLAITNHTFTGALLTQPYRDPCPLGEPDILLLEHLGHQLVEGTGYRVCKVLPDFTYDAKNLTVGVWSDTLSTVFGVAGYTLELWDPFAAAGVRPDPPGRFFYHPDPAIVQAVFRRFAEEPGALAPWRAFDHPQLGPVEIGGLDHRTTIQNPPLGLLPPECERGFLVADRGRRALPRVVAELRAAPLGEGLHEVMLSLENQGFFATSGLAHGETLVACPGVSAALESRGGARLRGESPATVALPHLDGWGTLRLGEAGHALVPKLPRRGHRVRARWLVEGSGTVRVSWWAGRAGRGILEARLGEAW